MHIKLKIVLILSYSYLFESIVTFATYDSRKLLNGLLNYIVFPDAYAVSGTRNATSSP